MINVDVCVQVTLVPSWKALSEPLAQCTAREEATDEPWAALNNIVDTTKTTPKLWLLGKQGMRIIFPVSFHRMPKMHTMFKGPPILPTIIVTIAVNTIVLNIALSLSLITVATLHTIPIKI